MNRGPRGFKIIRLLRESWSRLIIAAADYASTRRVASVGSAAYATRSP